MQNKKIRPKIGVQLRKPIKIDHYIKKILDHRVLAKCLLEANGK